MAAVLSMSFLDSYAARPKVVFLSRAFYTQIVGFAYGDSMGFNNSCLKPNDPNYMRSHPAIALVRTTDVTWGRALFACFFVYHEGQSNAADGFLPLYAIAPHPVRHCFA